MRTHRTLSPKEGRDFLFKALLYNGIEIGVGLSSLSPYTQEVLMDTIEDNTPDTLKSLINSKFTTEREVEREYTTSQRLPWEECKDYSPEVKAREWFDFYGGGGIITSDKRQVDWEHEEKFDKLWKETLETLEKKQIKKPRSYLFQFLQQEKIAIQSGYLSKEQQNRLLTFQIRSR